MGWREWLHPGFRVGGIYSISGYDSSAIRIAKVLKLEPPIVHLRIYKEKFENRPVRVEVKNLTLGTIHDGDGYGVGHLPVSDRQFRAWAPRLLASVDVAQEELDGYIFWKEEAEGSYFDLTIK